MTAILKVAMMIITMATIKMHLTAADDNDNDNNDDQNIVTMALGWPVTLGMLYDAKTECIVGGG